MESLVGRSVVVQVRGQLQPAVIRASTDCLSLSSDFSQVKVLLEWEGESEGKGTREWIHFTDSTKCEAVYVETKLLWAKRLLCVDQPRRAVAWPSKAYSLLCSNIQQQFREVMVVEYFYDKERVQLYAQETKELHLSEAKGTLISHPYLLAELEEWEESQKDHTLLTAGQTNLTGRSVSVYNTQGTWPLWTTGIVTAHNQQTKELSVSDDGTQTNRLVNPLLVHVILTSSATPTPVPTATASSSSGDRGLQRRNSRNLQIPSHLTNPDLLMDASGDSSSSLLSPHLSSPSLQETTSPLFPPALSSVTAYRTPSIDLHRRSSIQHSIDTSRMSEPNIFRRTSLPSQKMESLFSFHQQGDSRGPHTSPLVHSPTHIMNSPHLRSHMSSITNDHGPFSLFTGIEGNSSSTPLPLQSVERSKSLENISNATTQPPLAATHPFKRRMSAQVPLVGAMPCKRPRFELIPSMRTSPEPSSSLHRSMSLSALPRSSLHPFTLSGGRGHSTSGNHDDELDMIKEIIDRDNSLIDHTHTHHHYHHSLTNIPAELSISLPALHPSEELQVLHAYNSAPIIAHPSSSSSSASTTSTRTLHPNTHNSPNTEPLLPPNIMTGINGTIPDFLTHTSHKEEVGGFTTDMFQFNNSSHPHHQSYTQSSNSAHHCQQSDSAHSSSTTVANVEFKPNFNSGGSDTGSQPLPPLSPHIPILSEMLHTSSDLTPPPPLSSSLLRSALSTPVYPMTSSSVPSSTETNAESAHIAREAEVLCMEGGGSSESVLRGKNSGVREGGELDISVVVNQHARTSSENTPPPAALPAPLNEEFRDNGGSGREKDVGRGNKHVKKVIKDNKNRRGVKRGRGRPRLTEEEKQRRKELRELGLMKRSHRRTKEEVAQWRAERILSPAKRGRKPGSGKKNVVKAVTGKEVYVSMDLSKYQPGTILLQNGFCRAFPGIPRCMECSTCDGDLPSNRYCRFLEFRKIHIVESTEPRLSVDGFANYTDVQAADLVPWTPLKAGYSHMDAESALLILQRVAPQFLNVVSSEAATLPEGEVTPVWKRAVQGLREMCDTCDTAIFNFHWICPQCGFCICPACYQIGWDLEEGYDVPSTSHKGWPICPYTSLSHLPSSLIVAQIIPANVLSDVLSRMLKICEAHHIRQNVPRPLQQLISLISRQTLQSRFQNDRKGKSSRSRSGKSSIADTTGSYESSILSPHGSLQSSPLDTSPLATIPPSSCNGGGRIEEEGDVVFPANVSHSWLCNDTLLCLHDSSQPENMAAFQHHWRRGSPVIVAGVDKQLSVDMWTPQSFSRDFGEDYSELVDCLRSVPLPHYPSHVFWDGFEDMSQRLRDSTTGEPRLLKQKDWPPGEDFCEKLPKRFADVMSALPLPHYTKRDGKLNMVSSLPDFFVKPDMGPKMYNAYGSPAYPSCGTTNLHLDISDATNVMVYCSVAVGAEEEEAMIRETIKTECCQQTYSRVTSNSLKVGALWHIYAASDANRIRAFLRKVFEERGMKQDSGSDPIHDQLIYLNSDLRHRLLREYGVVGWSIAQTVGDAIFIPAGAPHQVRNLCSCIKVAEDFVSPEHVEECVKLTEEFRQLSDGHVNHEDKLQVKNIMYHSIKDVVGILDNNNSTIK